MTSYCAALLALILCGQPGSPEVPGSDAAATFDIWSVIPGNAWGVMVVNNPAEFGRKISPLVGVAGEPADAFTGLAEKLGIVAGAAGGQPWAVVLTPSDNPLMPFGHLGLLIPTTDSMALSLLWEPQMVDERIAHVSVMNDKSYSASLGDYTVVAKSARTVEQFLSGASPLKARLGDGFLTRFERNDACVWLDAGALNAAGHIQCYDALLRRYAGLTTDDLARFESAEYCGRLDPDGARIEAIIEHTGSDAYGPSSNASSPLLMGIPRENTCFVLGFSGKSGKSLTRGIAKPVAATAGFWNLVKPKSILEFSDGFAPFESRMSGMSVSVAQLSGGPEGILGITIILRASGNAVQLLGEVPGVVAWLGGDRVWDPKINALLKRLTYRRGVEQSGNISIDHIAATIDGDPATEIAELTAIFGQDGFVARVAAVDGQHVVVTVGGGLARLERVVATLRSGEAPVTEDPALRPVATKPARAGSLEAYLVPDRLVRLVNAVTAAGGSRFRWLLDVQENATVGVVADVQLPQTTRWEMFIPNEVLTIDTLFPPPGWSQGQRRGDDETAPDK